MPSKRVLDELDARGWKLATVIKDQWGGFEIIKTQPYSALYANADDDDARIIREAGGQVGLFPKRRKRHQKLADGYKREAQLTVNGHTHYKVLPQIAKASGVTIEAGWSGTFDQLATHVNMEPEAVAAIWRKSVEELRAMPFIEIT